MNVEADAALLGLGIVLVMAAWYTAAWCARRIAAEHTLTKATGTAAFGVALLIVAASHVLWHVVVAGSVLWLLYLAYCGLTRLCARLYVALRQPPATVLLASEPGPVPARLAPAEGVGILGNGHSTPSAPLPPADSPQNRTHTAAKSHLQEQGGSNGSQCTAYTGSRPNTK